MDESDKEFQLHKHKSGYDIWQAAVAWDREYLAGLAEQRKYPSLSDEKNLTVSEIRAGRIDGA